MDKTISGAYLLKLEEREEIINNILFEFNFKHFCYYNMVLNFLSGLTTSLLRVIKEEMLKLRPLKNIEKFKAILDIVERRIGE